MEHNTSNKHISQWSAFRKAKCPRCRVGKVFTGPTYSIRPQKMNENCPACDLHFEREPGYFYVAMFVSYAMNVAEMITVAVGAYWLGLEPDFDNMWYYMLLLIATSLILAPFNYRYSRMVLLYWLSPGLNYEPARGLKK